MSDDYRVVPVCSTCATLTPEEHAELEALAAAANMEPGAYVTAAIRRLLPGTPARVLKGARKRTRKDSLHVRDA